MDERSTTMNEFCATPLWNASLTWLTYDPDFTPCFQYTFLIWMPALFLLLTLPFHISWYLTRVNVKDWSVLSATKATLISLLVILAVAELIYSLIPSNGASWAYLVASIVRGLIAVVALGLVYMDRKKGYVTSGPLWIYWLMAFCAGLILFRSQIRHNVTNDEHNHQWYLWTEAIYVVIVAALLSLSCFADIPRGRAALAEHENPELRSSFINRLTFWWFTSMAVTGYKRPLVQSDMWAPNPEDRTEVVVQRFGKHWNYEMSKVRESERQVKSGERSKPYLPSLLMALIKTFWQLELSSAVIKFFSDSLLFVSPQILNLLIAFVSAPVSPEQPSWHGYLFAFVLFASAVFQTLLLHQYFHRTMRLGLQIRAAIMAAVYRKALRMSTDEKRHRTVGETVNLMSVDAQRLQDLMTYINMLWSAPMQIVLSLFFLWQQLGISALAGFAVMIILLPMNAVFALISRRYQVSQMKRKDERIKTMNEILSGIKVLKLYAWESSFMDVINKIRGQELLTLRQLAYINAFSSMLWILAPFLVALSSFACYVLLGNLLTPQKAFVSLALFNILRFPLNMLPMIISSLVQATVSIQRIKSYISAEELDENAVERLPYNSSSEKNAEPALEISDGTFRWGRSDPNPTLTDITVKIPTGKLVAVVGTVGSGKSSLCSALLGMMIKEKGTVRVRGRVAYVPQQAWIQNATVKDNICFANTYNEKLYQTVVEACALGPDLEMLSAGDMTEIGEKGINLSGGQKQRVSLARAVYSNADVFILDDPLSAVDAHVGKHIFDEVIGNKRGLLKSKTRLLVTHGLSYLPKTDLIVIIQDGRVQQVGTYNELLQSSGEFAAFLREEARKNESGQEDDVSSAGAGGEVDGKRHSLIRHESPLRGGGAGGAEKSSPEKAAPLAAAATGEKKPPRVELNKIPSQMGKLIDKETTAVGSVPWNVYLLYFKYSTITCTVLTFLFYMIFNGCSVGANIWLASWSSDAAKSIENGDTDADHDQSLYRLGIYAAFGGGQGLFVMLASIAIAYGSILASKNLHFIMLQNIMRSPMSFFDTTPIGRIVNRFSKDVDVVDTMIPMNFRMLLNTLFNVISTIAVIIYSTWIFVFVLPPLLILYWLVQRFYIATSRQLKRLESVTRSPIYSHFQESISGTPVIIATGQQERFILENETRIDINNISYYPNIASQRWLAVRLEFVGNCMVYFAALFAVISRDYFEIDAGKVGLSISYALSVTQTLNWMVRMTSELETNVVAVERIKEYAEVPTEAPLINPDYRPPDNGDKKWPYGGQITFDNYASRYRPGLELVLKGISCHISSGEKIGIVGRTGAGKSSLTLGLFRIVEPASGTIVIDNLDISRLGLQDLRSRLTVIPQDPVLFSGTLRMNLDPFQIYTDERIWEALEQSHLKTYVSSLADGLQYAVAEEGSNLSVGQRQLVCLARALLRKTQVLVLDEATAAVDLETDNLIQRTIRSEFQSCTVLTIAHRINTILDSTRVMVLDAGRVSEFDTPANLLQNRNSLFYKLCQDANLIGRSGNNNNNHGTSGVDTAAGEQQKKLFVNEQIRALIAKANNSATAGTPVGETVPPVDAGSNVPRNSGVQERLERLAAVHTEQPVFPAGGGAPTLTIPTKAGVDDEFAAAAAAVAGGDASSPKNRGRGGKNDAVMLNGHDTVEMQSLSENAALRKDDGEQHSVSRTRKFVPDLRVGDGEIDGDDTAAAAPLLPSSRNGVDGPVVHVVTNGDR